MLPKQLKEVMRQFAKTLNDTNKDEWWGTEKEVFESFEHRFIGWYNSNMKKLQEKFKKL